MSLNCHLYVIVDWQHSMQRPLICSFNSDLELRTRKSLRQRDTGCSSLKSSRKNKRESEQLWPFSRFTVPPRGTHSLTLFHPLIFFLFLLTSSCWFRSTRLGPLTLRIAIPLLRGVSCCQISCYYSSLFFCFAKYFQLNCLATFWNAWQGFSAVYFLNPPLCR